MTDELIGQVLDARYRIVGLLGSGGMGSVYEAEHLALRKRVAIKVIRAALVADEETRARFEREARATAQIEHPHVTTGMDFGRLPDGGAYLVVQLVRGSPLHARIEQGPVAWQEACTIGAQIADALVAIHAAGFVHRDLTPGNVLVARREDGSPHVHVLDLGVAALARESTDRRLTEEGRIVGTTGYMAPEQALGQRVDARADLYSLGVVLWEMCAGTRLRAEESLTQAVAAQLTESIPPVPQLSVGNAPRALHALIAGLLDPERERRPARALDVRDRLRELARGEHADRKPEPKAPKKRGALPMVPLAVAAVALVLAVGTVSLTGVALWALRSDPPPPASPAPNTPSIPAIPAAVGSDLDPALAPIVDRMLNSRWRAERRSSAEQVLSESRAPSWAGACARLTIATTCDDRQRALAEIIAAGRPEALPLVDRLASTPRDACGGHDCYACIRDDLEQARATLSNRIAQ